MTRRSMLDNLDPATRKFIREGKPEIPAVDEPGAANGTEPKKSAAVDKAPAKKKPRKPVAEASKPSAEKSQPRVAKPVEEPPARVALEEIAPSPVVEPQSEAPEDFVDLSAESETLPDPSPPQVAQEKPRRSRLKRPRAQSTMPGEEPSLPQSTRLPQNLQNALLRASMERKFERLPPFKQQDIVQQALTDWFDANGHSID